MAEAKKKRPCATTGCKATAFAAVPVCAKCFAATPQDRRGTPLPPNVDIRTFDDMPLNVRAVRDSDTLAEVSDEGFKAAFQLWCAAWHQIPAASLPDDDAKMARLAGYGRDVKKWKKIKNEALRGFLICSDGRLYHLYMADKAWAAWLKSEAGRSSANWRWENGQPPDDKQNQGMPTHSDRTSERNANPDADAHATADADAMRTDMPTQCSEQNRVEIDKSPPAPPESVTAREPQQPASAGADRVVQIAERIWEIAGQTQVMDRWRASAKVDDFRHVRAWIAQGWTEADILDAAQSIIGSTGKITSLWGLLLKAMPDAVDRIRNGTNETRVTPGIELNTPEQREFNLAVARYLGHLERKIWLPSYGDINAVPIPVREEANRRLLERVG